MLVNKKISILLSSLSFATIAYLYYVKRCYNYLKSLGYDGPKPKFFIGNLLEFVSKENSVSNDPNKPAISHYSKTLRRWTQNYGKIYGYYEGHSPVLVLADPDLVTEVFVNQNKLLTYRRSFPMSKSSSDPNADIFLSNGIRWLRVRYGLEKIMLNNKNNAKCLEYADESFINTFMTQSDLKKPQQNFDVFNQIKLFMIQTMFSIIFGTDLNTFINEKPISNSFLGKNKSLSDKEIKNKSNLYYTRIIAHKFSDAFIDFESFSLLKFFALIIPELGFVWRGLDNFKRTFTSNIYNLSYFADPMDWFYTNFINKHLMIYTQQQANNDIEDVNKNSRNFIDYLNFDQQEILDKKKTRESRLQSQSASNSMQKRGFCYFNSFLFLTYNPIIKYHQNDSPYRKISILKDLPIIRKRAMTTSERFSSLSSITDLKQNKQRNKSLSSININSSNSSIRTRHHSTDYWNKNDEQIKSRTKSTSLLMNDIESEDFENWKLTINEALSNTLLMFFAGFETTSSAMGFCCKVISTLPEQREKLLDEIKENLEELKFNFEKYNINPNKLKKRQSDESEESESDSALIDDDNDDVFEDEKASNQKQYTPPNSKSFRNNMEEWNDLYETLEKMKYLDMFVKEVLRMFPIANSMVSRKCVVDDLIIDNGNYFIPKNMNIVVDVLSIHYDPVIWGPVDPEVFYPERFLTERNPSAWLAFGVGSRKCLGIKLAMSQIKLFIVRLLQNYLIEKPNKENKEKLESKKFSDIIETKDILFNSPIGSVNISIEQKF